MYDSVVVVVVVVVVVIQYYIPWFLAPTVVIAFYFAFMDVNVFMSGYMILTLVNLNECIS